MNSKKIEGLAEIEAVQEYLCSMLNTYDLSDPADRDKLMQGYHV